jgi:branched-chain amino acid transport system permease protein
VALARARQGRPGAGRQDHALSAQENPPGVDFPADAVPGNTKLRQDAVNP